MLSAAVVVLRTIGLICCGHGAVALENLALRQQLTALKRTVRRPQLRPRDRLFWILSPQHGGTGAAPWSSSTPTRSCAGIVNGSVAVGLHGRTRNVRDVRPPMCPFGSSWSRWKRRIRFGERLGFTGNS